MEQKIIKAINYWFFESNTLKKRTIEISYELVLIVRLLILKSAQTDTHLTFTEYRIHEYTFGIIRFLVFLNALDTHNLLRYNDYY